MRCEGPFDDCLSISLRMRDKESCLLHMKLFCMARYERCEVYRMVMAAKYPDD